MPNILVATDFSSVSKNATIYACNLALQYNVDVKILHCYSFPIAFSDLPVPVPMEDVETVAKEGMAQLHEEMTVAFPQLQITTEIVYGDIVDALEDYAENNEAPLFVVAGNAHSSENPAWIDSTLLTAFRKVKFPVLGIPPEQTFSQIRKIGFAYDNKYAGSDVALLQLKEIAQFLGAELHVFSAVKDVTINANDQRINEQAQNILEPISPLYHVFYEHDVNDAIADFTVKYNINWLVLLPRKHNFLATIFQKSHTSAVLNRGGLPILSLHENH